MKSWWGSLGVLGTVAILTGLNGGAIPYRRPIIQAATKPQIVKMRLTADRTPSRLLTKPAARKLPDSKTLVPGVVAKPSHAATPRVSQAVGATPTSRPATPGSSSTRTPVPPPSQNSARPWVLGYYTQYSPNSVTSQASLSANLSTITDIAPLWYTLRANGSLHTMGYNRAAIRQYATSHGIGVYPLVTNAGANATILTNLAIRNHVVTSLTQLAVRDHYPGFNIDFEGLNYWDRQGMSAFVIALAQRLKPLGKVVTVAVIPKTVTDPYGRAYNFRVLGQYAAKVVLMTYDHHDIGSPPGPVAPMGWVTGAVQYALTRMPAKKIVLGLAAYGYNWGSNGTTVEVHDLQAVNLAHQEGTPIQWNSTYGEATFQYTKGGVSHTVWFENGYSNAAKIALTKADHLGGVAIWRLGDEDPHLWTVLQQYGY